MKTNREIAQEATEYCIAEGRNDPWLYEDAVVRIVMRELMNETGSFSTLGLLKTAINKVKDVVSSKS